jgi:hypothetical protein
MRTKYFLSTPAPAYRQAGLPSPIKGEGKSWRILSTSAGDPDYAQTYAN